MLLSAALALAYWILYFRPQKYPAMPAKNVMNEVIKT